jgi:hypothetical protein
MFLNYDFRESSNRATICADLEKALAPHGSDLRAGRALGDVARPFRGDGSWTPRTFG